MLNIFFPIIEKLPAPNCHWWRNSFTFIWENQNSIDISSTAYRAIAIVSQCLYTFYPILEDHFFVFKEIFSENSVFMYG